MWSARSCVQWGARRLPLLLVPSLVLLGLTVPSSPPAAAAVDCTANPSACAPPPMFNQSILQDPSSPFRATPEQRAALGRLEQQAVAAMLTDHKLPASDATAVRSWARTDTLAQLWALIVDVAGTPPGERDPDQAAAAEWLRDVLRRKGVAAAENAGWEYLTWAGYAGHHDPRPEAGQIKAALQRYVDGDLLPVNFNDPDRDASGGFCAYRPPVGFEDDYTGNIFTSADRSTADTWCFGPTFSCLSPLGCNDNTPTYDSFMTWGEAIVTGDPRKEADFAGLAQNVAVGISFVASAAAAGIAAVALSTSLATVLTNSALAVAIFPFLTTIADFAIVTGTSAAPAVLPASVGGAAAAAAVGAAVAAVIVVVTILVMRGIHLVSNVSVPGKLLEAIDQASVAQPDLTAVLADPDQYAGLYGLFIRALGPTPRPETCDNSDDIVFTQGRPVRSCANLPAVLPRGQDDPQFLTQPLTGFGEDVTTTGAQIRTDKLAWRSLADKGTSWTSTGTPTFDVLVYDSEAELRRTWFVTTSTWSDGYDPGVQQSLRLNYTDAVTGDQKVAWLVPQSDGSYKFLSASTGKNLMRATTHQPQPIDPDTCEQDRTCAYSDHIDVFAAGGSLESLDSQRRMRVWAVPRVGPKLSITHSANPVSGSPTTLTADNSGEEVSGLTYQWYVAKPSWAPGPIACDGDEFCAFEGPFSGPSVDYTWPTSGDFRVVLVGRSPDGRTARAEKTITVGGVQPRLELTAPATSGPAVEITGSIVHAGKWDKHDLTIAWGDGSTDTRHHEPVQFLPCNDCAIQFKQVSEKVLDFTATHTYGEPGEYPVLLEVVDQAELTAQTSHVVQVMGDQALTFPAIDDHTYGDDPFLIAVGGGRSGQPVELTATGGACELTQVASRTDGEAHTSAVVRLVASGDCRITATQAGSLLYSPATEVVREFEVAKAPLTVTGPSVEMILGGTPPALAPTYAGFVNGEGPGVVSGVSCTSVAAGGSPVSATTPVGSYAVTCSGGAAANYALTYAPGSLLVRYAIASPHFGAGVTKVKPGATLSLHWSLRDAGGQAIGDPASFDSIRIAPMTCGGAVPTFPGLFLVGFASALKWDGTTWSYPWKTLRTARGCHALTLTLADGTRHVARVSFR